MNPQPTAPAPGAPPKKSGMSGCLIALLVVGGIALVACLVGGVVVWRTMQDPEVQKLVGAVGKGAELVMKGTKAPGSAELRKAGCEQALVLGLDEMLQVISQFVDGGLPNDTEAGLAVVCQVPRAASAPRCEDLATIFVAAAKPTTRFMLSVQAGDSQKAVCDRTFEADGSVVAKP